MNNRSIEQCIENRYSRKNFVSLAREIIPFGLTEPIPIEMTTAEKEKLEAFNYLGETKIDDKGISLLEVKLKNTAPEKSPFFQRNLVAKYLKSQLPDTALVAFYSDREPLWKLSLVTVTYKLKDGKVKEELSEAKRFSFIVGENQAVHTASEQIEKIAGKENTYQDILDAFSIEKVTKDFFIKVASAFRSLVGGKEKINGKEKDFGEGILILPKKDDKIRQEFTIRLINRIIFCWFLKKKKSNKGVPLLSDEILSSSAINSYKNNFDSVQFVAKSYYHDIVEPLFFEMMNKPLDERLRKYRSIEKLNLIPFLNGGLFEPHKESDFYELDKNAFVSKHLNTVKVPDKWFKDFFKVLETYNFTVDENTPVDIELSIDPEMLGRIFENLLAEINPETGETARKSTGSYYTPRTIVEFMVDESIKYYLMDKIGIKEEKVQDLLSYSSEETNLTEQEKDKVLDAFGSLKIIDPACGSGAFPMGVLQKMLLILQKVDPHNKKWFEKFLAKIQDNLMRETTRRKFKDEDLDYVRKVAILKHSIYGVDIQPMATEISRLRAFLSLIVDTKIDENAKNRGIEPLPNLDFKFVTANSLIDVDRVTLQEDNQLIKDPFFERFEELTQDYFTVSDANKKNKTRKDIEDLIDKKVNEKVEHIQELGKVLDSRFGISKENKEKIAKLNYEADLWRSYKNIFTSEPVKFFNTKYFFPEVDNGFDIVIANPPYVDSETMVKQASNLRNIYRTIFESAKGNWDLFIIFIERGINLLKVNGIISYIVPNKLISAKYSESLRNILISKNIKEIRDYSKVDVFKESDVYPITFTIVNNRNKNNVLITLMNSVESIENSHEILKDIFYYDIHWARYFIKEKENLKILIKLSKQKKLCEFFHQISGAATVSEAYKLKTILKEDNGNFKNSKKFINTGTIDPYVSLWGYKNTQYIKTSYEKPIILKADLQKLSLNRCEQANSEKIIIGGLTKRLECFYDTGNFLAGKSTTIIQPGQKSLKFLTAVLNSKLISFWYQIFFKSLSLAGGFLVVSNNGIKQIPLVDEDEKVQKPFIDLVDQILAITSKDTYDPRGDSEDNKKVKKLEHQIDQMVYKLYDLTPEEIKIVEESVK
jgi:hypothetical protein